MFDPFGDFETAGYLRNELGLKDPNLIKIQEHLFFTGNIQEAAEYLSVRDEITYEDFCKVHSILFCGFYPWAGQDRRVLGVARWVSKAGLVDFSESFDSERAMQHGLRLGNDPDHIAKRPGEVMGLFAWGHPFLDGNGRVMVAVHTELMARAGLMVNWAASGKEAYLAALTHELESPKDRALDAYMLPLVQPLRGRQSWVEQIRNLVGLDGTNEDIGADIAYDDDDPVAQRRYDEKVRARQYTIPALRAPGGSKPRT